MRIGCPRPGAPSKLSLGGRPRIAAQPFHSSETRSDGYALPSESSAVSRAFSRKPCGGWSRACSVRGRASRLRAGSHRGVGAPFMTRILRHEWESNNTRSPMLLFQFLQYFYTANAVYFYCNVFPPLSAATEAPHVLLREPLGTRLRATASRRPAGRLHQRLPRT